LGGGVSKDFVSYKNYLTIMTPVAPAKLQNSAGVIGAAMAAKDELIV
jgi:polyphosphate glucokinase